MEFFSTAGRGTEDFVIEELRLKSVTDQPASAVKTNHFQKIVVLKTDGKVHFTADCSSKTAKELLALKSIERLFVKVYHNTSFIVKHIKALNYLHREIGNISWLEKIAHWRFFNPTLHEDQVDTNDESPQQKRRKTETVPTENLTFRISCKVAGKASKVLRPMDVCKCIGKVLQANYNWTVNLKQPTLEIFCQINNDGIIIGLPVTVKPLSQRSYLKTFGLRSTVAWIMSFLADIKPGGVVLDPMCGAGTILVEACHSWKDAIYFGADRDLSQLEKSAGNILFSDTSKFMHLIHSNVSSIPFRDKTVDVIICDTPFGINHCSKTEVLDMYPSMLKEMNRVLKLGGRVVLLIGHDLRHDLLHKISNTCGLRTKEQNQTENADKDTSDKCIADKNSPKNVGTEPTASTDVPLNSQWVLKRSQYLKLGETDSFVLAFTKQ